MGKGNYRGGSFGGMNQANLMRQAQKMQQDMLRAQQDVEVQSFSASAGGGMVTATVSGKREVTGVSINPEAVDPEDVEMLQDMIVAAVNEALRKAEDASSQAMSRFTSGFGGLGGLL